MCKVFEFIYIAHIITYVALDIMLSIEYNDCIPYVKDSSNCQILNEN